MIIIIFTMIIIIITPTIILLLLLFCELRRKTKRYRERYIIVFSVLGKYYIIISGIAQWRPQRFRLKIRSRVMGFFFGHFVPFAHTLSLSLSRILRPYFTLIFPGPPRRRLFTDVTNNHRCNITTSLSLIL